MQPPGGQRAYNSRDAANLRFLAAIGLPHKNAGFAPGLKNPPAVHADKEL